MDGLQQERYLWGAGGEARTCLRRLVVSDPNGQTGGLLFHCTETDGHTGAHVASMAVRGPVKRVDIHWWDAETGEPEVRQPFRVRTVTKGELRHGRAPD